MTPLETFDAVGTSIPGTKRSSMFGVLCYKLGRRPFISFRDEEIICKLFDEEKEKAMSIKGTHYFTPMEPDKPMTNWVCIPFEAADQWEYYAIVAHGFVEMDR